MALSRISQLFATCPPTFRLPFTIDLAWKIPALADPNVTLKEFKFNFDPDELIVFLTRLFLKMTDNTPRLRQGGSESSFQPNNYSVDNFAALLSHLVRNSSEVNWDKVGRGLNSLAIKDPRLNHLYPAFHTAQHMFGLDDIKGIEMDSRMPVLEQCYLNRGGSSIGMRRPLCASATPQRSCWQAC